MTISILNTEFDMGVAERKQREKQKRINDILDAAEAVFFTEKGPSASMDDVADRAEVSKGTLYLYFKNKESLYLGIGARANIVAAEYLQKGIEKADTGLEQVIEAGRAYWEYAHKYPHYFRLKSFSDDLITRPQPDEPLDPQVEQLYESIFTCGRTLAAAIERGIADGSIRGDIDPMTTTFLIWAQATGVIKLLESMKTPMDERFGIASGNTYEEFLTFVRRSIRS
jgi:AcrR family transcriptional regulator